MVINDDLNPEVLLSAYSQGWFPMAESKNGDIYWHSPDPRAIIPLYEIKTPKSVRQILNRKEFEFTFNKSFADVIRACADRDDTWISNDIIRSYTILNELGYAHSVEAWQNGELVGGLYGVAIARAFFGESMFNTVSNASKAAFYMLVKTLKEKNFMLLDTQYINRHTQNLGAIEIPKETYLRILKKAIEPVSDFEE